MLRPEPGIAAIETRDAHRLATREIEYAHVGRGEQRIAELLDARRLADPAARYRNIQPRQRRPEQRGAVAFQAAKLGKAVTRVAERRGEAVSTGGRRDDVSAGKGLLPVEGGAVLSGSWRYGQGAADLDGAGERSEQLDGIGSQGSPRRVGRAAGEALERDPNSRPAASEVF